MNINWPVIIIVGVVLVGLVIFLIVRNTKDEKKFERQQNLDYPKPKEHEDDVDMDEVKK